MSRMSLVSGASAGLPPLWTAVLQSLHDKLPAEFVKELETGTQVLDITASALTLGAAAKDVQHWLQDT